MPTRLEILGLLDAVARRKSLVGCELGRDAVGVDPAAARWLSVSLEAVLVSRLVCSGLAFPSEQQRLRTILLLRLSSQGSEG
jgi:hypothetical protein